MIHLLVFITSEVTQGLMFRDYTGNTDIFLKLGPCTLVLETSDTRVSQGSSLLSPLAWHMLQAHKHLWNESMNSACVSPGRPVIS